MITLRPINLHWLVGEDNPNDLCAHANVELSIHDQSLIAADDGEWCVSAAALYLLRSVSRNHTSESPVGEHLIPCCGHTMYKVDGETDVVLLGCDRGINWNVVHEALNVVLTFDNGSVFNVLLADWSAAVLKFSDAVSHFYQSSEAKTPSDDEANGYAMFNEEWERRRQMAMLVAFGEAGIDSQAKRQIQ